MFSTRLENWKDKLFKSWTFALANTADFGLCRTLFKGFISLLVWELRRGSMDVGLIEEAVDGRVIVFDYEDVYRSFGRGRKMDWSFLK